MSDKTADSLDISVFDRINESGNTLERFTLASQLAGLLNDPETPAEERDAVVPAVVRLAADPIVRVRKALASEITRTPDLHADIVFTIAADRDEIALDFLLKTPSLDAWRMMAIIKVGEPPKQAVIASRGDLDETVIEYIVDNGSPDVVAALIDNPCTALGAAQYKHLYVRLTDEPVVVDRLLECDDLPLEIRLMHAKRTSKRVYHLMAQRGWMAANDAEELVLDAEESTIVRILEEASLEELARLIPFMCDQQLLTPSIILRAACAGDLELVERAFSYLASVPVKRVRSMAGGRGLRTIMAKAGMPDSSFMLMRAVFDVAAEARVTGAELTVEQFGCKAIEFLMTRYETLTAGQKAKMLDIIAKFSSGRAQGIASRVQGDLQKAA